MLSEEQQAEIRSRTAASAFHDPGGRSFVGTFQPKQIKPLAPSEPDRRAWTDQAACKGMDPDLFFPERGSNFHTIRTICAICDGCPVRQECLDYAVDTYEDEGIWGGLPAHQRRKIRR